VKVFFIQSTHTDKQHIHNHIIFCNTNMINHKTFETNENRGKASWKDLRKYSDELCHANNLSVLKETELSGEKGQSHYEWSKSAGGSSWKQKLKILINATIYQSENFDDFLAKMKAAGAEIEYKPKNEIKLKYRLPGQQKFTRARTLGSPYDIDGITERVRNYRRFLNGETIYVPKIPLIDTDTDKMRSAEALTAWARVQNVKTASEIMLKLEKKGINNLHEIDRFIDTEKERRKQHIEIRNALKTEVAEFKRLSQAVADYRAGKPVHMEHKAAKGKKAEQIIAENAETLKRFEQAKETLKSYSFENNKLPDEELLAAKIERISEEIEEHDGRIKIASRTVGELEAMKTALNNYLGRKERSDFVPENVKAQDDERRDERDEEYER